MKKNTILLIFLVIVFIVLACSSLVGKSLVCDESAHHIPVGYVFLKTGDFSFATDWRQVLILKELVSLSSLSSFGH